MDASKKYILEAAVVVLLMGASFFVGQYTMRPVLPQNSTVQSVPATPLTGKVVEVGVADIVLEAIDPITGNKKQIKVFVSEMTAVLQMRYVEEIPTQKKISISNIHAGETVSVLLSALDEGRLQALQITLLPEGQAGMLMPAHASSTKPAPPVDPGNPANIPL